MGSMRVSSGGGLEARLREGKSWDEGRRDCGFIK